MFGIQNDLVTRGSETPAARAALEGLVQIRETLDRQAPSLDLAAARAHS